MKNIVSNWDKITKEIGDKSIVLFLDFDGTLSPIAKSPDEAFMPCKTRKLLEDLSKNSKCELIVISGRALQDVKEKVGVKGLIYAGNHGLQIEGPNIKLYKAVSRKYRNIFKKIKKDLAEKVSFIKGARIEDKGLSLSLHYRLVGGRQVRLIKDIFRKVTAHYALKKHIKIEEGKKLLEVRPLVDWDKGKAVLWLLSRQKVILKDDKIIPVYIGDDITDEDAFRALKRRGITVFVGRSKKSYAKFYLKDTEKVRMFLLKILKLLETKRNNDKACQSRRTV